MKPRISMITLGVKDLNKSIKFYKEGLGFPKMESPPEVEFFTLNGSWLGLFNHESLAEDVRVSSKDGGFNSFTLSHNVKTESQVDEIMECALSAGASITKAAQKTSWGGYAGCFKDPDGHLWEIAHNPFFWVGPKDEDI